VKNSKIWQDRICIYESSVATVGYSSTTCGCEEFVLKNVSKSPEKVRLEMGFDGQNLSLSGEFITE
jgi:hypothetical protein